MFFFFFFSFVFFVVRFFFGVLCLFLGVLFLCEAIFVVFLFLVIRFVSFFFRIFLNTFFPVELYFSRGRFLYYAFCFCRFFSLSLSSFWLFTLSCCLIYLFLRARLGRTSVLRAWRNEKFTTWLLWGQASHSQTLGPWE